MKEGEKVKVLDLPNDQERKDGIYEEFWKVRDPHVFAKKILDQKQARKYFRSEGLYKELYSKSNDNAKIDFRSKDKIRKIIKEKAKNKDIFEIFAQKDIKRIQPKIMCKYIRAIMQKRKDKLTVEESVLVWTQCSGSLDLMRQNQQYYKKILEQKYIDTAESQIDQDIKRSKALVTEDSHLQAMKRIFIAYARRNESIGYCQGLNYIVAKFLKYNIAEEDSFWLLVQLLENILPLDYYPSMMMGVVCDQKIFEQILRVENEKVYKKLMNFETNWIVCLFTQALDDSLLIIAWNHLFTKGSIVIFKVCLVMINYCKKEILKSEGLEVVKIVENKLKNWKDTKKFSKKLEEIYINEKGINFMREFYKQICVIQLKQKSERKGNYNKNCNPELPTCQHLLAQENGKYIIQPPEFFIFMTQRDFNIDWNYFKSSKVGDLRNVAINEDVDIMQTKHVHICNKQQISSQVKLEGIDQSQQTIQQQVTQNTQTIKIDQEQQEQKQNSNQFLDIIKQKNVEDQEEIKVQIDQDIIKEGNPIFESNIDENENGCELQQSNYSHFEPVHFNDEQRYSSDSNLEPKFQFNREDLDNSNSFRFFSDITKQKNKFNYLITNKNNVHSEISKVIQEVQDDI